MRKFTASIQKTGSKILYKLNRAEGRCWKANEKIVAVVTMRGNKSMDGCFENSSIKIGADMHKVVKKKH